MPILVTGHTETARSMKQIDKGLEKLMKADLKEAVEPVAVSGREKIGRYRGARTGRIRPVVTTRAVLIRQSESKKTGKRGDFGSLQWRLLAEALDDNEDAVVENVREAYGRIQERAGL